jgi:hypothetical protein
LLAVTVKPTELTLIVREVYSNLDRLGITFAANFSER